MERDQRIRVGRVADHEHAHVAARAARQRGALRREDRAVGGQQVAALHALLARHGADEQGVVGIAERDVGVVAADDAREQRECAVVQLHRDALERAQRGRDLEQLQDDGLIRSEELSARDAREEAVTDLAGGARDGDANWGRHAPEPSEGAHTQPRTCANTGDFPELG